MTVVINQVPDKTNPTYDWIRYFPSSILQWDEIPLLGISPPFPWEELSQNLSKTFSIQDFNIELVDTQWRTPDDLIQGFVNPAPIFFSITSMEGHVTWIMNRADLERLLSHLILKTETPPPFTDQQFFEGFYQFVAIETLQSLSQLDWDKSLAIHTFMNGELPSDPALCLDISIRLSSLQFNGRLLISNAFRKSWAQHYSPQTPKAYLETPLAEQLTLPVGIQAGRSDLSRKEWDKIAPGDYLILDQCSIDSASTQGTVIITVNEQPIFSAERLSATTLKILELTHPNEERPIMNTPPHEDEDEFEEEELDFDEEEFDLDDEEGDEEFEDQEFDEDFEGETSLNLDEDLHKHRQPPKEKVEETILESEKHEKQVVVGTAAKSELFSPGDVPLAISVEIGRLHLPLQKLMELAPGNMLEIGVKPDNGVDLVYQGKCIARGELLRIGETLGVRILEKG